MADHPFQTWFYWSKDENGKDIIRNTVIDTSKLEQSKKDAELRLGSSFIRWFP